jgi:hypothetical protein
MTQQVVVAIELAIAIWLMADIFGEIRFVVDKFVPAYVLWVPGGILATSVVAVSVVAFVPAGLSRVMDIKVVPGG